RPHADHSEVGIVGWPLAPRRMGRWHLVPWAAGTLSPNAPGRLGRTYDRPRDAPDPRAAHPGDRARDGCLARGVRDDGGDHRATHDLRRARRRIAIRRRLGG